MAKESTITITIKAEDQASVILDKVTKAVKKAQDDVSTMSRAMQVVSVAAFINIAQQVKSTAAELFRFAEMGAHVKSIEESFVLMGRNSGIAVGNLIQDLKKATRETVDDSDLIKKATRMMAEGFSGEQIVRMGEIARVTARLMGVDVTEAYERVSDAVLMLRARGLKSAGIMIDLDAAYEKHAKTLGTTKERLNEYGKQMALFEAVSKRVLELENQLGIGQDSLSEKFQKAKATWKDVWEGIAKTVALIVEPILILINLTVKALEKIKEYSNKGAMDWKMGKGMSEMEKAIDEAEMLRENPALKFGAKKIEKSQVEPEKGVWDLYGMTKQQYIYAKASQEEMTEYQTEWIKLLPSEIVTLDRINQLWEVAVAENEKMYEFGKNTNELWRDSEGYLPLDRLREMNVELAKMWATASDWNEMGGFQMFGYEGVEGVTTSLKKVEEEYEKIDSKVKSFAQTFSSIWDNSIGIMLDKTKTWSEKMRSIFDNLLSTFIGTVTKMIAQWLLFGSTTGAKDGTSFFGKSKSGWGGIVGGILGLISLQHGGVFDKPTPAIIGEAGPEAVIPLKGGKIPVEGGGGMGGMVVINNVYAIDVKSFEDQVTRNPGCIINVLAKNVRAGGQMRGVIRGS